MRSHEWLLKIRAGEFLYEDLLKRAEDKIQMIDGLFKVSDLPEQPEHEAAERKLVEIRDLIYRL